MRADQRDRLRRFWRAPLTNKLDSISVLYYKFKGRIVYRMLFQEFGSDSYIRKPLLILNPGYIRIGNRVSIRDGVRLEVVQSETHQAPCLSIGDDTNIEQSVHIVCHSRIQIGSKVSITGHCAVVDVIHPFEDISHPLKIGARIKQEESFVEIGDGSFLGYGSVILPNVRLGRHVVIGANSVVNADVPDYSVAAGVPAVVLKRYDLERKDWISVADRTSLTSGEHEPRS